jgi:hypothetical protein
VITVIYPGKHTTSPGPSARGSQLDFADTAGIRLFLLAAKTLRQRGGDLVLLRPQRTLARILEILGAEGVLAIWGGTGATHPSPNHSRARCAPGRGTGTVLDGQSPGNRDGG